MLAYIAARLMATIPVMGVVAIIVFAILRLTPGDPAAIIAGDAATSEQLQQIRIQMGLDKPLYVQFILWAGQILRGDLGISLISGVPVAQMIADRIGPTLALSTTIIVFSIVVAVPLGVIAAWRQGTLLDRSTSAFSVLGFSMPVFVIGYLLDPAVLDRARLAARSRIPAAIGRILALLEPIDPADPCARHRLYRVDHAHHAHQRARGHGRGLYPHGAREGSEGKLPS